MEIKITKQDLQNVLNIMIRYRKLNGYFGPDESGKVQFYDSEPSFGAAFVTLKDIKRYIKNY